MGTRTITNELTIMLINHGLWPDEADAIMALAMADESLQSMRDRWNDDVSEYPFRVITTTWLLVKRIALDWVNANKPSHFAKMILSGEIPTNLGTAN